MQIIFEYPYILITIFVFCFIILSAVGIYFAIKGVKTAKGNDEIDFTTLNKLETSFEKSGKLRENRCVIYIRVPMDSYRSLYSDARVSNLFSEIKAVLLQSFCSGGEGAVCCYGDENIVALTKWTIDECKKNIDLCYPELNKCLQKYGALKVVDIRVGSCFAMGTQLTFDEAINRAKQACMLAKNQNVPYAEWNVSSGKALEKKIKIENSIEKEIDNNRFFLEYQPFVDAKTKKIIGAEVLSRLNSESDGVLTPGSFLSAVDSVGINEKFDYYIFEKNCKWICNDKKLREDYKYTINFSRSTLCERGFAEKIINIAEKYNLKYSCLAVEILEDKNLSPDARQIMMDNLSQLKDKGMSVLLDDFGSGYTTFGDLQTLDISIVKIDKSITQTAVSDTGFIILRNIISTAKDIGFATLCEGIETEEQEKAAIKAGCDILQGYYYYRPMPVAKLERLFDDNHGGE